MSALSETKVDAPPVDGPNVIHTGSISSDVELDLLHGEAHKVYHPSLPVRLMYWLAFQAPFPYRANHHALEAARLRRIIVDILTKFWFGHHLVARVVDVADLPGGRHDFVTRLVEGHEPERSRRARAFLRDLDARFMDAGLPTWQTTPYNPHAITNFVETPDGTFRLIDLESSLVALMYPVSRVVRLVRLAHFPSFDDIDVARLSDYVKEHSGALEATLPEGERVLLDEAIAAYAREQELWHRSERRYLPRGLRFMFRFVDVPSWMRGIRRIIGNGQHRAITFVREGIDEWVAEARLSQQQGADTAAQLEAPPVTRAVMHMGAHFAISLPLRFPLGALGRFAYTAVMRLRSELSALRRPDSAEDGREMHTLTVALVSLVPGFGRLAYLFARPIRSNRMLFLIPFDKAMKRLPARAYERLHLRALVDWWAGIAKEPAGHRAPVLPQWSNVRAHAGLIVPIAAANIAISMPALYLYATLDDRWQWWTDERGALDIMTAGQLAIAAAAAGLSFSFFWRAPARAGADAAGIFLWGLAAMGLTIFAIDDYFGVHEAVGEVIGDWLEWSVNLIDQFVSVVYVLIAAGVVYVFRHELFAPRASSALLLVALALSAVSASAALANDAGVNLSGALANPAISAAAWLMAAGVRLREVLAEAQHSRGASIARGRNHLE